MKMIIEYENEDFVIVSKPAGLPVYSTKKHEAEESVISQLLEKYPQIRGARFAETKARRAIPNAPEWYTGSTSKPPDYWRSPKLRQGLTICGIYSRAAISARNTWLWYSANSNPTA